MGLRRMNTPAHAVLNLLVLERGARADMGPWIVLGAVMPDIPNGLFFAYHRFALGLDSAAIYADIYAQPQWQAVLAPWHSVLLVGLFAALAFWRRRPRLVAFSVSMLAHLVADVLTHASDAHPHLYPLSELRITSPVSYWDAAAGARWFVPAELVAVLASSVVAWRRGAQWWRRVLLVGSCAWLALAYVAGWAFWGTS